MSASDITAHIEELESYSGRGLGPRVIARAWSNPEFKKKLLDDGVAGVTELGMEAEGWLPYGGVTGELQCTECAACMVLPCHSVQQCMYVALPCLSAVCMQRAWCCTVTVH